MNGRRGALWVGVLAVVCVLGGLVLHAQVRNETTRGKDESKPGSAMSFAGPLKLEDLLERPISLPFAEPTPLSDVVAHLAKSLHVRVVLDPAAMGRLDLVPDDTLQVELEGKVHLRTALPLILDGFNLTYRFVAEDDLLVLTDAKG